MDRKKVFLIIAWIVLAGVILYRFQHPFVQKEVAQLTYTGAQKPDDRGDASAGRQKGKTARTRTEAAEQKKRQENPILSGPGHFHSSHIHKDLFGIYEPPGKKGLKTITRRLSEKIPPVAQKERPEDLLETIKAYLSSYQLYGTYKDEKSAAVFLAKNKKVLVARIGDRLDGKYQIDDIRKNRISFRALDLDKIIHLDMREFSDDE